MRTPVSWIREYADLPADLSSHDLARRLTALGLKLEAAPYGQILAAALSRCGVDDAGGALTQFVQVGGEWLPSSTPVATAERPPMREVRVR